MLLSTDNNNNKIKKKLENTVHFEKCTPDRIFKLFSGSFISFRSQKEEVMANWGPKHK